MQLLKNASFYKVQWLIYTLLITSFIFVFFHRFAPASFAEAVMEEFNISATALGTLAAIHFYTYTIMQVPSGILIDRMGPRVSVSIGTIVAGVGSIIFGLAPSFSIASVGPFIVGIGVSTIFVGIMKSNSYWFPENKYGMISGVTLMIGNLGAVLAAGPLAVFLKWFSWRDVFITIGLVTVLLSVIIYIIVRDTPYQYGFQPGKGYMKEKHESKSNHWFTDLKDVCANKYIWFVLLAGVGTNSTFYAFAGLWGIPLLRDSFGLSNHQASIYTTVALGAYGVTSLLIGWFSDKIGLRKPLIIGGNVLATLGWLGLTSLPWQSGWSGMLLYILVGISASQIVITFAVVKEVVPSYMNGIALAFLNAGVFLGVAILQTMFGWMMDISWNGVKIDGVVQYTFENYMYGLLFFTFISLVGVVASVFVKETNCQSITHLVKKTHN